MKELKDRIKLLRKEESLTQREIACRIGIAERSYRYLESGTAKPALKTLMSICENFAVPADFVLGIGFFDNLDIIEEYYDIILQQLYKDFEIAEKTVSPKLQFDFKSEIMKRTHLKQLFFLGCFISFIFFDEKENAVRIVYKPAQKSM